MLALPAILAGAALLRAVAGVGFANYDTLYALAWGGQLARGSTPAYETAIAPTPHPLVELVGLVLSPLSPRAIEDVAVALGFIALAACGWVIYALAERWFGRAAGVLAAAIFLTRVPVLSYGVRAYIDIPYLLLVLWALLLIARDAHKPVAPLALLAAAGLLRPEAWVFSGLYLFYVLDWMPTWARRLLARAGASRAPARPRRSRTEVVPLVLLAASAPLVWLATDLTITGDVLWSLKHTRHTAHELGRVTGIANVPQYIPRRVGEILRPPVLAGGVLGLGLSLWWLRGRALVPAAAGLLAVVVFAVFATLGLPINSRYAFLTAAIGCVFAGAGVFGWSVLPSEDRRRRPWIAAGAIVLIALIAYTPASIKSAHRELTKLARQEGIQDDLIALVKGHAISLRCGPVGVPNHAPVPLLALYMEASPRDIANLAVQQQRTGVYVDPASKDVETAYVLDPRDPIVSVSVPPGFGEVAANRSWIIFERCA
ncbi:MAG TPA: hypothetical protein VH115_09910 [Solirubrobacteraceae bacterium]|nr:hypothetical protein [Solirubrobacteraceae bacterium]